MDKQEETEHEKQIRNWVRQRMKTDGKKLQPDNESRDKHYGLRRGDIVEYHTVGMIFGPAMVVRYDRVDNNKVYIGDSGGDIYPALAEYCKILSKVEDYEALARSRQKKDT